MQEVRYANAVDKLPFAGPQLLDFLPTLSVGGNLGQEPEQDGREGASSAARRCLAAIMLNKEEEPTHLACNITQSVSFLPLASFPPSPLPGFEHSNSPTLDVPHVGHYESTTVAGTPAPASLPA